MITPMLITYSTEELKKELQNRELTEKQKILREKQKKAFAIIDALIELTDHTECDKETTAYFSSCYKCKLIEMKNNGKWEDGLDYAFDIFRAKR